MTRDEYQIKIEAKRDRMLDRVDKLSAEAKSLIGTADELSEAFAGGQPILVGHHSERKSRLLHERVDTLMRRGIDKHNQAQNLQARTERVGTGGISSDDPNAACKLKEKLERLERERETIKQYNCNAKQQGKLIAEAYVLSNLNANIRATKKRIAQLESQSTTSAKEDQVCVDLGLRIVDDKEANRIKLFFDNKPTKEVCRLLRRAGFLWSSVAGTWQRKPTANAWQKLSYVIKQLRR